MPKNDTRFGVRVSAITRALSIGLVLCLLVAEASSQNDLIFLGNPANSNLSGGSSGTLIPSAPRQPTAKSSGSLTRVQPSSTSIRSTSQTSGSTQPDASATSPTSTTTPSNTTSSVQRRLDALRRQMSNGEIAEQQKVRTIEGKIDRIKWLIDQKRKRANTPPPVVAPATPPTESPNNADSPVSLEAILGDMDVITEKSVDPMGLANNLFAIGELNLALKMYQEILADEDQELQPGNKVWVQYQIAGCYRRLGQSSKAETAYRIVAGNKVAPYWAERARWWLTTMGTTARIKERDLKLVNTLTKLKDLTNELSEDNAE